MDYNIMTKDSNERTRARREQRKQSQNWDANRRTQARKASRARQRQRRKCRRSFAAPAVS